MTGWPRLLLRLEGGALLGAAVGAYAALGHPWLLFAGVVLLPDVGIAGYASGTRIGAAAYNALHTELGPALLAGLAWGLDSGLAMAVALAWFAHIGMDRLLGYGLKHGDSFRHTHLGWIGRTGHP